MAWEARKRGDRQQSSAILQRAEAVGESIVSYAMQLEDCERHARLHRGPFERIQSLVAAIVEQKKHLSLRRAELCPQHRSGAESRRREACL